MKRKRRPLSDAERERLRRELCRDAAQRQRGYREQALRLLPHVCASCGREFEGSRLRELTVHHKDHDHRNNPPDGSNWELLCLYCHDHEHEKHKMAGHGGGRRDDQGPSLEYQPFADLDGLLGGEEPGASQDDAPSGSLGA
jgi:hypothetical protein